MNEQVQLKLHDIKDIVNIPDNSIFIFSILVFLLIILFITLIIFIIKRIKNKKINKRKEYYKKIGNIDYKDSKSSAYILTKYLRLLARSPREVKLVNEIIEELEAFKYKKNVSEIKDELKAKVSIFMETVDV